MTIQVSYGLKRTVALSYEDAIDRITAALKENGFGILTEIDVKATMKKKLDVDVDKYVILGACNPHLAHRALTAEQDLGLLLPCNVIVYESENPGESVISIIDPKMMAQVSDNDALPAIAEEAYVLLDKALSSV